MDFRCRVGSNIFVLANRSECKNSTFPFFSRHEEFRFSLTLIQPFDYEIEHFYQLTVQIRDAGENSVSKFVTIEISVFDENDNDPQAFVTFLQPFSSSSISILENTPIGQISL